MAAGKKKSIEQYDFAGRSRTNNWSAGLVTSDSDYDGELKVAGSGPHLDPTLQWAEKAQHAPSEVPTVLLHVHERLGARTIIEAVKKEDPSVEQQTGPFETPKGNVMLRQGLDFYGYEYDWSNRLLAGYSLRLIR